MPKVLAQVGVSLADVYQVLGSIAGVEQLISHDVNLVHEMGATIFSERLSAVVERATTGAIAQSTTFDVDVATGGVGISRVLGVLVFADVINRADFCQVSSRGTGSGREMPFYHWDQVSGTEEDIRLVDNGGAAANVINLVPAVAPQVPNLRVGLGQQFFIGDEMVMRGQTTAFGAGTVEIICLVYTAFNDPLPPSSRGLPVPSW